VTAVALGVWFPGGHHPREAARLAVAAEASGVDSVWVAEGQLGRDAFVCLAAIAAATERVRIGTAIVNPYTRHPAQLAASFGTLDELAEGRVICGIGIGARDQLAGLGYDVSKPLAAARESVTMVRALVARETVTSEGAKFRAEGARLGFRPPRAEIPVYLAATGPKMCALAGEVADGVYLIYGAPEFLERAIANTRERRPEGRPFDVACQALLSVDDDPEVASARVRPGIGFILTEPNGEDVLRASGIDPAKAGLIREALAAGGVRAMAAAVDEEIIDRLTISGTRDACLAKMRAAVELGVSHLTVSLLGDDPEPALDLLASFDRPGAGA
jgi:5,10-methylenetetrahydromethanopterin reductase